MIVVLPFETDTCTHCEYDRASSVSLYGLTWCDISPMISKTVLNDL